MSNVLYFDTVDRSIALDQIGSGCPRRWGQGKVSWAWRRVAGTASTIVIHLLKTFSGTVSPLIGRYCGMKIPPEIVSSTGLLSLSFHTDMAVAKDGFSARYNMTRKDVTDSKCDVFPSFSFIESFIICKRTVLIELPAESERLSSNVYHLSVSSLYSNHVSIFPFSCFS